MTTPISPEIPPSAASGNLAPTIDAIVGGDFSRSRLTALSDLDRGRAAYLRSHWQSIPDSERHALLLALADLGEHSLEYNFNRVYRIALGDPNPIVRQLAIADLWEDEGRDLPATYVQMLREDPSDDVRAAAADALSATCDAVAGGDEDLLDSEDLIELFSSIVADPAESPLVRRRSLGAVAAFGADPRVSELIRFALDEEDQAVVAGAIHAMGRTSSDTWMPELLEYMKSEDAELRYESARAAGMLGEPDAVPELAELVYDPDAEVRAAAVSALGEIGGPAAARVLRQLELDEDFPEDGDLGEALDGSLDAIDSPDRPS